MNLPGVVDSGLPPSWIWPIVGVWLMLGGGYVSFEAYLQTRRLLRLANAGIKRARGLHRMSRAFTCASITGAADGEMVRLRGVVECEIPLWSQHARQPAVVARWSIAGQRGEPLDSGFASRPFSLRLCSGECVGVHVGEDPGRLVLVGGHSFSWWVAAMGAWRGGEIRETVIVPGDEVEVLGRIESVVDPSGLRSGPRAVPMSRVLAPAGALPLVLSAPQRVIQGENLGSLAAELAARRVPRPLSRQPLPAPGKR